MLYVVCMTNTNLILPSGIERRGQSAIHEGGPTCQTILAPKQ